MLNVSATYISKKRFGIGVLALIWASVGVLVVFRLYMLGVQGAQHETEQQLLTRVAPLLDLPTTADRNSVLTRLEGYHSDLDLVKKAHVAQHLQMDIAWGQIFQHIEKLNARQQADALQMISKEYSLPAGLSRDEIQHEVAQRVSLQMSSPRLPIRVMRME